MRTRLRELLAANAYPGYVYGYPHKKAYRPLPPISAEAVWRDEPRDHLSCYVHMPFCSQRCSFCNLFTYVPGSESPTERYLGALTRQMESYAKFLMPARFARLYVGGGTPTFLSAAQLRRLTRNLRDILGVDLSATRSLCRQPACSPLPLYSGGEGRKRPIPISRSELHRGQPRDARRRQGRPSP